VTKRNRIVLALAGWPLLLAAAAPTPAALTGGTGDAAGAAAAARMVRSFIDYTRWPTRTDPVVLCVVGVAALAGQFDGLALGDGRRVVRRGTAPHALGGCNVAYFGKLAPDTMRQALAAVRGKAVLTIAESDPQCRIQTMFCLVPGVQGLTFALNIDAISRSGLRVDPRVLRLGSGGGR
jgi:YfiR/HmsC-like